MKIDSTDFDMNSLFFSQPATRRICVLGRILHRREYLQFNQASTGATAGACVTIGNVTKEVKEPRHPEYVPRKYYLEGQVPQDQLRHLRWMLQKDLLGQDMFMLGRPGPQRRRLALQFLQATCRELEFVSLSRDTTESDLKQRREIRAGTAMYFDQSAVRAAVEGRILVLEGIEKAERNVLPVLNNLLENREMRLEDGRFLIPASRYDKLLQEHSREELDRWQLVRVSEDFRVVALGIPVPRYLGNPLDPPLRSRFQARDIGLPSFKIATSHSLSQPRRPRKWSSQPPYQRRLGPTVPDDALSRDQEEQLRSAAPSADPARVSQLLSCCYALLSKESASLGLPDFPLDNLPAVTPLLEHFPGMSIHEVLYRLYPYHCFLPKDGCKAVEDVLRTFSVTQSSDQPPGTTQVTEVLPGGRTAVARVLYRGQRADVEVSCGSVDRRVLSPEFVPTPYQDQLLAEMLQSHLVHDICLMGPRGCGKSATVRSLSNILGYQIEPIVLYQDMTSRDLIQQRSTLPNGDTVWQHSPLVTAALEGKMAVLDGIHRVHASTLAVVSRLVQDRELQLYDGQRLLRHDRYDELKSRHELTDDQLRVSGVLRIHPSFRIVALAEPPALGSGGPQWLTPELLNMFVFHEMRPLALSEELQIVRTLHGDVPAAVRSVMELAHRLRDSTDPTLQSLAGSLSTRQLLRVARRMAHFPADDPVETIHKACLARFLPSLARQALDATLTAANLRAAPHRPDQESVCEVSGDQVTIGRTTVQRYHPSVESKVPDILFFNVPQHVRALEGLLQDFSLGEHLLLVGNQGVGKNKLADRLLQLLRRPREYIQLHRDTTVQTLTLQPTVREGVVVYEDSPLVQAARLGHVLVVDEADKAPTHVTCILKTLVESGEMILSDGRRIVPQNDPRAYSAAAGIIPVHPDFRMIVLANRPGFPFLGNDFFAALGDLFSCHAVDNPSTQSELSLLRQYGPSVPQQVIERLVKVFGELRSLADQGLVQYPYSTREVVNIVKHLEEFPSESLSTVVQNVFDFDSYSPEVQDTLRQTLHKHGIPIGADPTNVKLAKEFPLPAVRLAGEWTVVRSREPTMLPAECRMLKTRPAVSLRRYQHALDKVEARASSFSEMLSYWLIPLHEGSIIAAAAVSKSVDSDPLHDVIHVLASNPLSLYTMVPSEDGISELSLQGMFRPQKGARPQYSLAPVDGTTSVLVHERTSNTLLVVDVEVGQATPVPLRSTLESAAQTLSRAVSGTSASTWHLLPQLLHATRTVVLFSKGGSEVEVVNVASQSAISLSMPFPLGSLHLAAIDKWLVEDSSGQKYMLSKRQPEDQCPNVLRAITETNDLPGPVSGCTLGLLGAELLGQALGQTVSAPHRVLSTEGSFATVVLGFPDLDHSSNEVYVWPRKESLDTISVTLLETAQVVRPVPVSAAPRDAYVSERGQHLGIAGFLEVVDLANHKLRYIPVPQPHAVSPVSAWMYANAELPLHLAATSNSGLVTVDAGGCVRLWETGLANLEQSLLAWRKMIGSEREYLQMTVDRPSGKDVSAPKHGKVDEKGDPHVGGNTWAGGTGGRDTAGLGGKGGPYRLDAGHKVHQVSQAEKDAVPEHVKKAAHDMAQRAFKQRLREINMSQYDAKLYEQFSSAVSKQVQALRVILGSLQAKSKERQWLRHQTSGELDDAKLIEGLTGERNIYRRRAEAQPELGAPQMKPKRLRLVVDVSGSMYRFNSYDGRLDREMEAAIMVMEAFEGHEGRIQYDIVGHSGETSQIVFVSHDNPPTDNKQRLNIIKTMHAHAQFCLSGDNTLEATQRAISAISREDCDEAIVVVLSDANFDRYGIPPQEFARTLTADSKVNAYAIFIGSLGDQATRLTSSLPSGRAFVCLDLKNIPQILQQVFSASVLNTR